MATAIISGNTYVILTIGTTNFTLIGAASNTVGLTFTATGVGAGTGTVSPVNTGNTGIGYQVMLDSISGGGNTAVGNNTGRGITSGGNNTIIGANVTGLSAGLANNTIIADGSGAIHMQGDSNRVVTVRYVKTVPVATAALLSPAVAGAGARAMVTDSSNAGNAFGNILASGGTTIYPVHSNGTNWIIG